MYQTGRNRLCLVCVTGYATFPAWWRCPGSIRNAPSPPHTLPYTCRNTVMIRPGHEIRPGGLSLWVDSRSEGVTLNDGTTQTSQVTRIRRFQECKRQDKWRKMMDKFDEWRSGRKAQKLRSRVRKGVPDCVRGKVWQMMMGSMVSHLP